MNRVWGALEIAKLIGIRPETVKNWAKAKYIPEPSTIGLKKKKIWGVSKTLLILEFARDVAGYFIPERVFDEVRGYEAENK